MGGNVCKCPECGAQLKVGKGGWIAKSDYPRLVGQDASTLKPDTPSRPARTWTKSRTWERTVQAVLAGGAASVFCLAIGKGQLASIIAPLTTCAYWFGSTLLGAENWDVAFRLLDFNKDGKIGLADIEHLVNAVLDKMFEPEDETVPAPESTTDRVQLGYAVDRMMPDRSLRRAVLSPDYPRYVTKNKLRQVARLHLEVNDRCNFSKRYCGEPFGDELTGVQDELERLGYIQRKGKAANAARIWTPEGERWLERFL